MKKKKKKAKHSSCSSQLKVFFTFSPFPNKLEMSQKVLMLEIMRCENNVSIHEVLSSFVYRLNELLPSFVVWLNIEMKCELAQSDSINI